MKGKKTGSKGSSWKQYNKAKSSTYSGLYGKPKKSSSKKK